MFPADPRSLWRRKRELHAIARDCAAYFPMLVSEFQVELLRVRLSKHSVVLGMATDPEPKQTARNFYGQCAIVLPDPHGPETAGLLEVERWMTRITLQRMKVLSANA